VPAETTSTSFKSIDSRSVGVGSLLHRKCGKKVCISILGWSSVVDSPHDVIRMSRGEGGNISKKYILSLATLVVKRP
jgi:hypothetical protein